MQNISTKVTGGSLTATEFNQIPDEMENLITDTGQALSGADLYQLSKSMATYATGGAFFADSGTAGAYVLSAIGSKRAPAAYFDGMTVAFSAGNTNTGASTVNVAGLGVKSIVDLSGVALTGGELVEARHSILKYDLTLDAFQLLPLEGKPLDLAEDPATTTGLTWGWLAGQVRSDNVITDVAAGTILLTDNATNYVEYSVILGMTVNQVGFTQGAIPVRTVVTLAGVQTSSYDKRAWLNEIPYASAAEAQALTDLTKVITPATLDSALKGANQSLAVNGYQKLPGGLIFQFVQSVVARGTFVSFPITFPTAVFAVAMGNTDGSAILTSGVGVYDLSLSGYRLASTVTSADGHYTIAIGY